MFGFRSHRVLILLSAVLSLATFNVRADDDSDERGSKVQGSLSVMVLGSGGPMATASGRASAGYLIFVDGVPKVLMDVGGGTYQRLAASGVNIRELKYVLLSHLHIDHTGDLSPVIKTVYFHARGAKQPRVAGNPIHIWGPNSTGVPFPNTTLPQYPSSEQYVHGHYQMPGGVERYLNLFATAISGGKFEYTANNISPSVADGIQTLISDNGLVVKAIGVMHGPGVFLGGSTVPSSTVPAVAFRVEYNGHSIAYSGDTSSLTDNMITISQGADLLIYDTAITDTQPDVALNPADAVFFKLHTTPTRLGQVATAAGPRRLVLSHLTPISEPAIDNIKQVIRAQGYAGRLSVAKDLKVYNLDD